VTSFVLKGVFTVYKKEGKPGILPDVSENLKTKSVHSRARVQAGGAF